MFAKKMCEILKIHMSISAKYAKKTLISLILGYSGQISTKSSRTFSLRGAQVLDHPVYALSEIGWKNNYRTTNNIS